MTLKESCLMDCDDDLMSAVKPVCKRKEKQIVPKGKLIKQI